MYSVESVVLLENIELCCYGTEQNSDKSIDRNLRGACNNDPEEFLEIELYVCPYKSSFLMKAGRFDNYNLHLSAYYCHIQ